MSGFPLIIKLISMAVLVSSSGLGGVIAIIVLAMKLFMLVTYCSIIQTQHRKEIQVHAHTHENTVQSN